ncbi:MAG: UvrD-helicase domain-containing protein, partial [Gammaproteobacteria bacterium]|nr:UvrD-helicase domain-containing protein [Gammaproteobacteria bacterium]
MSDFDSATLPMTQSQLIEASAGTGKTYTITNLCLRLLLGRGQAPLAINQILILTFTIAATDELKHRVASRIREARKAYKTGEGDDFLLQLRQESADPARDLKLLTAAGQLMDEASIFTIHGFCARVLGEQAFESGVLFNQDLNGERDQLLQTAAEDCFRRDILGMRSELRDLALSLWQNPTALAGALKPYLFRGELDYHPSNIETTDSEAIIKGALAAKAAWLEHDLPSILKEAKLNGRRTPMRRLDQMTAFCQITEPDLNDPLWQIYSPQNLSLSVTAKGYLPQHPALDKVSGVSTDASRLKAWLWYWLMQRVSDRIQLDKDQWQKLTLDDLLTRTASAVIRPGSTLADTIARRWPVAMIDEFQDTDSIQYSIFQKVYPPTATDKTLMMIGDPKQAIYNFRGADVYTYINARRQVAGINSLSVNWRSSPALIDATNHLFNLENIFGNDEDMPFQPVSVAPPHVEMGMTINGDACRPYQIYVTGDAEAFSTIDPARESTMSYAADQTVRLISAKDACVDDKPINAGQIAFLVRNRDDAKAARAALQQRGVKSVYLTMESVFLQDTAHDLRLILEAIAEPTSDHAIRAALATQLMQCTAEEIESLNDDVQRQQSVLSEFREYHELWLEKSIAPMLNTLLSERQLAEKWLNQPDGERQLTNLRHLIELLQQRAMTTPGIFQLIKWFTQEQRETETVDVEERQLRLESDENLVKIVTMHAAKGLEYDIVMIPMPVFSKHSNKGPALFHKTRDGQFVAALELGDNEDHREQSSAEDRAE